MTRNEQAYHRFPVVVLWAGLLGGLLALYGTYWDEAWHTDVGRDSTLSPPHVVLYVGTAVVLGGIGWWAWQVYTRDGLVGLWRDRPVRLALLGAAVAAASAPIDVAWHALFGRDAVLWSPPHMLGVTGFIAVAAGILTALRSTVIRRRRLVVTGAASLLLAVCLVPVVEYEGDAPQFPGSPA